jgi:hypothetical protein
VCLMRMLPLMILVGDKLLKLIILKTLLLKKSRVFLAH